jgi:hypothetical protein
MLSGGKNRFGGVGEVAWFEMAHDGLQEIDPGALLRAGGGEPGSATALPRLGRRALAVEVQALVVPTDGPARRQATGLDPGRFQLVVAVLDRMVEAQLARAELFGATSGGVGIDDPECDLAVAAALASAASGVPPPPRSAFVGDRPHRAGPRWLGDGRPIGRGQGGRADHCVLCGRAGSHAPRPPGGYGGARRRRHALEWAGFGGRSRAKRDRIA